MLLYACNLLVFVFEPSGCPAIEACNTKKGMVYVSWTICQYLDEYYESFNERNFLYCLNLL